MGYYICKSRLKAIGVRGLLINLRILLFFQPCLYVLIVLLQMPPKMRKSISNPLTPIALRRGIGIPPWSPYGAPMGSGCLRDSKVNTYRPRLRG